jgi:hypothetical protein
MNADKISKKYRSRKNAVANRSKTWHTALAHEHWSRNRGCLIGLAAASRSLKKLIGVHRRSSAAIPKVRRQKSEGRTVLV